MTSCSPSVRTARAPRHHASHLIIDGSPQIGGIPGCESITGTCAGYGGSGACPLELPARRGGCTIKNGRAPEMGVHQQVDIVGALLDAAEPNR